MTHFFYVIKNKYLIIISLLSWANIGFLYVLHLNESYTTLIGIFKPFTTIPSLLCGILFPVWLLVRVIITNLINNQSSTSCVLIKKGIGFLKLPFLRLCYEAQQCLAWFDIL